MSTLSILRLVGGVAAVLCLVAVAAAQVEPQPVPGKGIQPSYMDTTVSPCENFYLFADGRWLKEATIPPDRASWESFTEVYEHNLAVLHDILNEAAKNTAAPMGSVVQKVGTYYRDGMDSAAIEKAGVTPLRSDFARIEHIQNIQGLLTALAYFHRHDINPAFNFFVDMDFKDANRYMAWMYQGGLGLPNCNYYTKTDDQSEKIKKQYVEHVTNMFKLLGEKEQAAGSHAQLVMQMETDLAKSSMTPVEERDPVALYHKYSVADIDTLTPGITWKTYFTDLELPGVSDINIGQPAFFKALAAEVKKYNLSDWKTYLRWHLIHSQAPRLSSAFVNENFRFYGTILRGTKELQPRWKRMIQATDRALGEALGQLYVEKAFSPQAKARAVEMVQNLKSALRSRIEKITWITEPTREKALKKLDAIAVKIGYPDKWRDYSTLKIEGPSFVVNAMRADEFEFQRNLNKLGNPVDRSEWQMTPPTVNAYYNPTYNEIVFPAGILQPPFFDEKADDAVNYGGIGSVIGHELTHGFDDEGRKFDAKGNLEDWWTPQDEKNFNERAELVVRQYDGYAPVDTFHINGKLTLGENLADLGGVKIAYTALQRSFEGKQHPAPIDGYTAEQRFFIAYGQEWKEVMRPEYAKLLIATNPHSPNEFRVIGPLTNLPEFLNAFHCSEGKMSNSIKKAEIW